MNLKSNQIRLIAFDLDGTLLNAAKVLTQRNKAALEHAAEKGILIVPTTGRLFDAIPEEIREFPFLRYAITINGAAVFDTETGDNIYRAEIPIEQAIEIMSYLDKFPIIYDCYKDNTGWMTQSMWDQAEVFAPNAYYLSSIRTRRKPVPELKEYLREQGGSVQKIQLFSIGVLLHNKKTGRSERCGRFSYWKSLRKMNSVNLFLVGRPAAAPHLSPVNIVSVYRLTLLSGF